MVLFGLYFTIWRNIPKLRRAICWAISQPGSPGALRQAAGLSGALPTMWCAIHDSPKADSALQPFNLLIHIIVAALMIWQNRMSADILWLALLAIPTDHRNAGGTPVYATCLTDFSPNPNWLILLASPLSFARWLVSSFRQDWKRVRGHGTNPGWS